jgi:hypothetical protein
MMNQMLKIDAVLVATIAYDVAGCLAALIIGVTYLAPADGQLMDATDRQLRDRLLRAYQDDDPEEVREICREWAEHNKERSKR